jgi:glucose-1-phosphate thymidylyltransferase
VWGIIPAAGAGSRIQPLAFSKELLPVGTRVDNGVERPRAVSEYLVERMIVAGADKLCFVISPAKTDILQYYGARLWGADIAYVVQPAPGGLCDAIFRAVPFVHAAEPVLIGLPDTIWLPQHALAESPDNILSLLLFPVEHPELFDAVSTDENGNVQRIHVKQRDAPSNWIWGAVKMPGQVFHQLYELWRKPGRGDEYLGTLINAWLDEGGNALGVRSGMQYVDTGTLHGYRSAVRLLEQEIHPQNITEPLREEAITKNELTFANRR